jgi:hypothetical protein
MKMGRRLGESMILEVVSEAQNGNRYDSSLQKGYFCQK